MAGSMLSFFSLYSSSYGDLPTWLQGLWDRDDVYVMDASQEGAANDGLTAETSWPAIVAFPCVARASATYPSPNGTRAYPNGVKVIVFLPGDYSMRKMHSVRVEEYWPHWSVAPDAGLEPSSADPLILVYASADGSYADIITHPADRPSSIAEFATLRFTANTHGVYVHGLNSEYTYSGIDFEGSTDGKVYRCQIGTDLASGITRRYGADRNETAYNLIQRRYPWSALNDYAGLYLKDGPNVDCWDHHNVVLDYADAVQGACRSYLYRQDPLTINITAAGTGYTVGDALVFGAGTTSAVYRTAVGTVTAVNGGGGITAVTCTDMGAYEGGYPSVTIVGTGSGATFTCTELAGPLVVFGHNLVAPDIWEQGWPENTGYGGIEGYLCEDNWFGCTDATKVSNVYSTIGGIENCVDLKTGGTLASPAIFRRNKYFGLRANLWSPSAVFTFHDVCSHVEIYDETIIDCSSVFNFNAQYHNDRYASDGGSTGGTSYPAWESFTTINIHDCTFANIEDFATTGSWTAMQGRLWYGNNTATMSDNTAYLCDYFADELKNASADAFVFSGNTLPTTVDLDAYTGALPAGWSTFTAGSTVEEVLSVPYTGYTITVRSTPP